VAVGGIVVIAVLTRIPNLLAIPAFTDEVEEVALGLDILRHGLRPLTNVDPYIGPLWNYILAGALWLSDPSAATPRILMLMAGTLTVLLTYALGRVLHGRRVGLLASTLLATSAVHTAVNSHIAWSNCVTPLFTTAGLLVLARALRDARPRLLVPAGLLFGLAFQTHPTAAPVLVGGAVAVLAQRRSWLASPWPYLAGLLAVASNANLIVYNLQTGGRTFSYAAEIQDSYVRETGDAASYGDRLGDLLLGMVRAIGGVLDHHATLLEYAREPLLWVATGLTLLGLWLAVRHRSWLPVLVVASTIVMLPLVNPKYDPILNGRYLAPILPLGLIWVGLALEWLASRPGRGAWSIVQVGVAAILATSLVVGSLGALTRYYDNVRENARTGERILDVVRTAQALGKRAQPVVLDQRLDKVALGPGAGIILRVLRTTLELEGVDVQELWLGETRPAEVREGQLVVLASRSKPQFTQEAVTALGLRDWRGGAAKAQSQASLYGMYRFGPVSAATESVVSPARPKPASLSARPAPTTNSRISASADAANRRR
jgi:4-amino-4-deoxy-L-arabinose transferase-like glycosyltransferase